MKQDCCIKTINQVENFLKEHTFESSGTKLVRFMVFEWAEFKTKLIAEKKQ